MKLYVAVVAPFLLAVAAAQHLRGSDQRELAQVTPQGIGSSGNLRWYNFGPFPSRTTSFNGVAAAPTCSSGCPTGSVAYSFKCSSGSINSVTLCSDNNAVRGVTAFRCANAGATLRMSINGAAAVPAPTPLPTAAGCGTSTVATFSDTAGGGFRGAQSATTSDNRVALLIFAGFSTGRFSPIFGLDGLVPVLSSSTRVAPTDSQPIVKTKSLVRIPSNYPPAPGGNEMGYCSTTSAKIAALAFTVTGTGAAATITGFGLRCS